MPRPRLSLGLEASRATLNGTLCAELGNQLAAGRKTLGLTVAEVAAKLLLTPRQVDALESVNTDAFYGPDFYAIALRKYATLVGLDARLIDQAIVRPEPLDVRVAQSPATSTASSRRAMRPASSATLLGIAAAVVMTTGVTALMLRPQRSKPTRSAGVELARPVTPPPPAPMAAPIEPVAEVVASTTATTAVASIETSQPAPVAVSLPTVVAEAPTTVRASLPLSGEGAGSVKVARPTWIFVRYVDNTTVERGLGPGEAFVLQGTPTYLAVGSAEDAAVVIAGHTIDNSLYTTNGQLRVGSSQLARLATQQQ